jgi:hypothetical protein
MKAILRNTVRGLGFGLVMATGFTAWITVALITSGNSRFEQAGTPFWTIVWFYYCGFSLGGLLAGTLWSLLHRWAVGWAIMGAVMVLPVYGMVQIFSGPPAQRWSAWNFAATIFVAAIVGGLGGLRVWSLDRYGAREPGTNWRFVAGVLLVGGALAVAMYLAWW